MTTAFDLGFDIGFGNTVPPEYGDARVLLTLIKVKQILGITDASQDAILSYAMPIVTDLFEDYCLRGLAYDDSNTEEQALQARMPVFRFPINEVLEFFIDGVLQSYAPMVDSTRGFVYGSRSNYQMARMVYSGGFKQDFVPKDLADAYAKCVADYSGATYVKQGASVSNSAPLKTLSLGSGALAIGFDNAVGASARTYDVSDAQTILQPYAAILRRYQVKDYA